jgi:uncharacterized protein (TIGR00288 family)
MPGRSLLGRFFGGPERVGVFVDGPNVFREEFDVDLATLRGVAEEYGRLSVARVYLDEHASAGLTKAVEANGFDVRTTASDVDVRLATEAAAFLASDSLDTIVVVTRDSDFKPLLEVAAERGVRTVALAPGEHGRSTALSAVAHEARTL